jgi:spermidine synthase
MADLPATAIRVQALLVGASGHEFVGRVGASALVAFAHMAVPALFMGLAFPAASAVWCAGRPDTAGAVGRLLAVNTVGAILGPIVTGFVLIRVLGVELSLQLLVLVNLAVGGLMVATLGGRRWVAAAAAAASLLLVARVAAPGWGRAWDRERFARFVNNARPGQPDAAPDPAIEAQVVFFREGVNETVSVVNVAGLQSYIVNGRPEASTAPMDVQLQLSLGHIPMLLHPAPRSVFILGTGTAMTLGATARHPGVERLVLGEIEAEMIPVGRTFARWNRGALDDPRLRIVVNDGRNHLATTDEKFDVISADPIHPWSGGAGYLYTADFFRTVSRHLAHGGVASQWLPLYELSEWDVKTVVRTFAEVFPHVLVFVTYYDAVLVGSNEPFEIDPARIAARLAEPSVRSELASIAMGTSEDLLAHFVMGTTGARRFAEGGVVNTDDNLALEFSAPASQGRVGLDGLNVLALGAARESLAAYARAGSAPPERWQRQLELGRLFDEAHGRFLLGDASAATLLDRVEAADPDYAPLRFIREEQRFRVLSDPSLVAVADFECAVGGRREVLRLAAVRQYLWRERVLVSLVDNAQKEIYGQRYLDGPYDALDAEVERFVRDTLDALRSTAAKVPPGPAGAPGAEELSRALRDEAARRVGRLPSAR